MSAGGVEVATEGDSFFVVFKSARSAVAAAAAAQRSLAAEPWPADVGSVRVRMGLHTGEGTLGGDNYIGVDVNRAARIAAAAHGGQVLLSKATAGSSKDRFRMASRRETSANSGSRTSTGPSG